MPIVEYLPLLKMIHPPAFMRNHAAGTGVGVELVTNADHHEPRSTAP